MPRKKTTEPATENTEKSTTKINAKDFIIGTGRRKTAVARVWLKNEKGDFFVNEKIISEVYPGAGNQKIYEEPLRVVNRIGQFSGSIKVSGGGTHAQLEAIRHGITRALANFDSEFRSILSKKKLLTRDSRMKERRKYGHAGKARKMKQSPKR